MTVDILLGIVALLIAKELREKKKEVVAMIGNIDVYEIFNRAGMLFALLLIVILLMYIAFWKNPTVSASPRRAK